MDVNSLQHHRYVERYYRYHSGIYDATRWSFLFGRKKLLRLLPKLPDQPRIFEVGCGTGRNLATLAHLFPQASIKGMDLSEDMLSVANKKLPDGILLAQGCYGSDDIDSPPFDLILLSYSFTMMGNRLESIFQHLDEDLKPNGCIAVVDFNNSPFPWFCKWMKHNHVNMNGKLLPRLRQRFQPVYENVNKAYLGLWSYFLFIGKKH